MRVVAGRLGGRKLVAPRGETTRPTIDRVREALFSVLGALEGARVLDLYAGTGALGIEALSRGAATAVFVESDRAALAALETNLKALALGAEARVFPLAVERALARVAEAGPYDLVFADPPYADVERAARNLDVLAERGALGQGAWIVLEHARKDTPKPSALVLDETRLYGDTALSLFRFEPG
jgi:16S rRNA (guanine(966)-N(2))-methyltransferase RsmD